MAKPKHISHRVTENIEIEDIHICLAQGLGTRQLMRTCPPLAEHWQAWWSASGETSSLGSTLVEPQAVLERTVLSAFLCVSSESAPAEERARDIFFVLSYPAKITAGKPA